MVFAFAAARPIAEDSERLEDAAFHRDDGQRECHDGRGNGWVIRFSVSSRFSASSAVSQAAKHPRRPRLCRDLQSVFSRRTTCMHVAGTSRGMTSTGCVMPKRQFLRVAQVPKAAVSWHRRFHVMVRTTRALTRKGGTSADDLSKPNRSGNRDPPERRVQRIATSSQKPKRSRTGSIFGCGDSYDHALRT
jgi:hypothetical protein